MKLLQFEIEGFGDFRSRRFGSFDPKLNVFFGPNEAGKTTLLNFIRTMLVGFPRTWRTFYAPTGGIRHGGSLLLKDSEGHVFTVHREAGANGGSLRLEQGSREIKDAASKMNEIMGELSSRTYNSVFAFGLSEVQELSLLENEEIKARIYSVGLGVQNLPLAVERIATRREQIFTERGRNKRVFGIQQRLDEIEIGLGASAALSEEYGHKLETFRSMDAEVNATTRALATRSELLVDSAILAQASPICAELQAVKQKISALPIREELPEDAMTTVESIESRLHGLRETLRTIDDQISILSASGITYEQANVVRDAKVFEGIRLRRSGYDNACKQLMAMTQDRSRLEQEVKTSALALGWTLERLNKLVITSANRERAYAFRTQFETLQQTMRHCEQELARASHAETESQAALETLEQQLLTVNKPNCTIDAINTKKSNLRSLKKVYDGHKRISNQRKGQESELQLALAVDGTQSVWPRSLIVTIPSAVVLLATSMVIHGFVRLLSVLAALTLALASAWLFARKRRANDARSSFASRDSEQVQNLKAEEERLLHELQSAAGVLGVTTVDEDSLATLEDLLESEINDIQRFNAISDKHSHALTLHQRNASAGTVARTAMDQAHDAITARELEWGVWKDSIGLDTTLSPEECPPFLDRLEEAQRRLVHLRELEREMSPLEEEIETFKRDIRMLADGHGINVPQDLGESADILVRRLDEATRANIAHETNAAQLEGLLERRNGQNESIEEEDERLQNFLRSVFVKDSAELRRVIEDEKRLRSLQTRATELDIKLSDVAGERLKNDTFKGRLQAATRADIALEKDRLNAEVSSLHERKDDLTTQKARLATQMEELERKDRTSELLSEKELLLEELAGLAREWSVYTLASALLARTKARYEAERKPAVIEHAERFIGKVTGGKYQHVSAPADTKDIHVVTATGVMRSPDQLSRGTLEQLYLALRFGLVRQFSELAVPLPVIVDEIFVNFDPERASRVADAFVELSMTNQVIVLTCHPWVVELLTTASRGKANIITLAA